MGRLEPNKKGPVSGLGWIRAYVPNIEPGLECPSPINSRLPLGKEIQDFWAALSRVSPYPTLTFASWLKSTESPQHFGGVYNSRPLPYKS